MDTWMESQSRNGQRSPVKDGESTGALKHLTFNVFNTKSAVLGGAAKSSQV